MLRNVKSCSRLDRISSLPDDLLSRILSLIPTRDAVATSVLSRRWKRVFSWTTNFNFDASPCLNCPLKMGCFTTFVDTVLQICQSSNVTRFSFKAGQRAGEFREDYFADLEPINLNAWMCFPLTRGVRELDLCVHIYNPQNLPCQLFSCETLEVLKLEVNLDLQIPTKFCLPNLKVFHLHSVNILDGNFLTAIPLGCPLLEDLAAQDCYARDLVVVNISSPSLQRLVLDLHPYASIRIGHLRHEYTRSDVVLDTPNLQHLEYVDNLASRYSIGNLNALVEASINVIEITDIDEHIFQTFLGLLRPLSNVQNLSLSGQCLLSLSGGDFKEEMPVFHKLNALHLDHIHVNRCHEEFLALLNHSPFLERFTFPYGTGSHGYVDDDENGMQASEEEFQYWRTLQVIPTCLKFYVKKIVIGSYYGIEREYEMVKYFMRNALVLEELVISCMPMVNMTLMESMLEKLPRGSMNLKVRLLECDFDH